MTIMQMALSLHRSSHRFRCSSSLLSFSKKSVLLFSYLRISACFSFVTGTHQKNKKLYSTRSVSSMTTNRIMSSVAEDIEAYNSCASAAVVLSNAFVVQRGENMFLRVTRTAQDIENDSNRNYEYTFPIVVQKNTDAVAATTAPVHFSLPPTEVSSTIVMQLSSPSGNKIAIIRNDDPKDKDDKTPPRQVLELWTTGSSQQYEPPSLVHRMALPTNKQHGKVINDSATFGRPCWSPDEKVIAYLAERQKPETTSFFDPVLKEQEEKDNKKIPGGKNTLGLGKSEQWGEQYHQQEALLDIFLLNLETGRIAKVENVPGEQNPEISSLGRYTLSQCVFSPDGQSLLYTAWDAGGGGNMPKRLGLIYCQQRPSKIYASSIARLLQFIATPRKITKDRGQTTETPEDDDEFVCLTPRHRLARSPRFSPADANGSSKLVFLASEKGFDVHYGHLGLHGINWNNHAPDMSSEKVLVKQIWDIRDTDTPKDEGEVEGIRFPGLALLGLPEHCFVSPDTLVTDTIWGSSNKVVRVNVKDGSVRLVHARVHGANSLSSSSSLTTQMLLCNTPNGGIIVKETAPNAPGTISYISPGQLLQKDIVEKGASAQLIATFSPLSAATCAPVPSSFHSLCEYSYEILTMERPGHDGNQWSAPIQSILMLPHIKKDPTVKPPLVVLPHGGPHSVSTASFMPEWAFLCSQAGYALLLVNYRGSVGFGQGGVEDLPSRIGDLDVKDLIHSVQHVVDSGVVDADRLGICGGSHGGFLTGHCIGQYPELFKAACMRNPVTNVASMSTTTDIPDWCVVEACGIGKYDWTSFSAPTKEQMNEMYDKSPVAYVQNVKTPTLVAIGTKDLRVPPSQGLEFYHILRSRGIKVKLLLYDDCDHPIGAVCSKADHWINIKRWFDEHL